MESMLKSLRLAADPNRLRVLLLLHRQIRHERFNLETKKILQPLLQFQRFLEQQPRVERENRKLNAALFGQVHHHQTRTLKAGADGHKTLELSCAAPPTNNQDRVT